MGGEEVNFLLKFLLKLTAVGKSLALSRGPQNGRRRGELPLKTSFGKSLDFSIRGC